ncbi:MAG TPA: type II toxin-antitoxin system VapC family toxin [Vicinamibacterales bacterium]
MTAWAVIDTSVYIGHWEHGLYNEALERVRRAFIVRHSAVVLSELRRGARTRAAERTVARLHALARDPWTPNQRDWWETGRLIRTLGDAHDWDRSKRRDFQNDALIALTARRHGATVVTANREDFELLGRKLGVRILAV